VFSSVRAANPTLKATEVMRLIAAEYKKNSKTQSAK
jgi:hypothetical protein